MVAGERTLSIGDIWQNNCLFTTKVRLSRWITLLLCIQVILPIIPAIPIKRSSHGKRSSVANLFRKRGSSQVVVTSQSHDWCASNSQTAMSRLTHQGLSVEHPEDYDWDVARAGLLQLGELAREVSTYSDKLQAKVDFLFNNDPDNTKVFAEQYLDFANTTPEAKRETRDNAIHTVMEPLEMARKIEVVMWQHAMTMSRMLVRLELLHTTESHEELKAMLWAYSGDTRIFLCKMQEVFHEVAPHDFLPGPTDAELDMNFFEKGTLGEKKNHIMRWYGTYGVSLRQQEILDAIQSDFELLQQQISEHWSR